MKECEDSCQVKDLAGHFLDIFSYILQLHTPSVISLPAKCSKGSAIDMKLEIRLGLVTYLCMYNLALRRLREVDSEFEASLRK